ncbi:AIPR family protein [Blautia sp. An81]|uniref:AIPR family protein n=1 Tax=Blautia sp. An81 TaxID=1965659 RepID=UPI000B38A887|nr:AIPR family protein [Blautia sp. An81]OUN26512.1 hypothetical protein B5G33_16320 [Blautia sp. An81]
MAKNDQVLIDSIIEERIAKKLPSDKKDEVFEFLVYEQVLKEYDLSIDDIRAGSVDGRNDGGIDAIYILVNGHLINDIKSALLPKANANLEVYFFTCKHRDVFKQDPVNSICTSLQELLDFSKEDRRLDGQYNEEIFEKRNIFISIYKKVATILERLSIKVIFASRGDAKNELGDNVEARGKQIETICRENFSGCTAKFEFWGSEEILAAYRKKADYSLVLNVDECLSHGKQMVVLVKLKEYYKFITYDDKKIRKYLFDSNVRDFMGINAVNEDILETLNNHTVNEDFWWLNNGITILCSSAIAIGKSITIENVQIVNGLQTSECIYKYFGGQDHDEDNRVVLIKILPCESTIIADDIIRSTNNQTVVMSSSLRATDKIQEDIEDILRKEDLYYERRVNYYSNQGIPISKIYSPLYLAKGYMALVLKRPYRAVALKQKFMRNQAAYEEVFSEKDDLRVWPIIAKIMRKTDDYMNSLRENNCGERFLHNVRYQVALLTVSRLLETFTYSIGLLLSLDINKYTFDEVKRTWEDIQLVTNTDNNCRAWRNKQLSLDILKEVAEIEKIKNVSVIVNQIEKCSKSKFSNEFLEEVQKCLPKQPWPNGIHESVAKRMGISSKTAANAIGELMKRKMAKMQKNGKIIE